jgi:hypothetical protein
MAPAGLRSSLPEANGHLNGRQASGLALAVLAATLEKLLLEFPLDFRAHEQP